MATKPLKKVAKKVPAPKKAAPKAAAAKAPSKSSSATKTSTATKTATATKTSTDAYTQGNITVTGGAGRGATIVKIGLPGGSLANKSKKQDESKVKKK